MHKKHHKCIDCGELCWSIRCRKCASLFYVGKNATNWKNGSSVLKHKCKDCGKIISICGTRCKKCNELYAKGEFAHHYKGDSAKCRKNKCINCGKTIGSDHIRCNKCHKLYYRGENTVMWKGGHKRNNCVDCGKKILAGSKRCQKCAYRGKLNASWKGKDAIKRKGLKCIDCGRKIKYGHTKCKACYHKQKMDQKINYWKYGIKKRFCKNCNKLLNRKNAMNKNKFCNFNCYTKHINKYKLRYGKNNPTYGKKRSIEYRRKMSLSAGGTGIPYEFSGYGIEFTKDLKEYIRNRDGRKCQVCGCPESKCKKKLDVHHKDYNKKNNDKDNLISLCNSCHSKTRNRRKYWQEFFVRSAMMKNIILRNVMALAA